jgi:hypothetical protein
MQKKNLKISNKSFERLEQLKYLGTNVTKQNYTHEEIKSRLKSGECLLSFGVEYFVFQFTTQKCKD